ncbi:hypothetical protein N9M90_03500 [Alphaproteobacteria bacterium]|nr:hypothetical protein [Alphaproteobacteria bacterium]
MAVSGILFPGVGEYNIRVEQIVLYFLMPVLILMSNEEIKLKVKEIISTLLLVIVLLIITTKESLSISVMTIKNLEMWLGIIVAFTIITITKKFIKTEYQYKYNVRILLILGLIASAILILTQYHTSIKELYLNSEGLESKAFLRSDGNERYTGIFSQPYEAGLFFSLNIMLLIYARDVKIVSKGEFIFSLIIFMYALLMSGSKIILILPLVIALAGFDAKQNIKLLALIGILFSAFVTFSDKVGIARSFLNADWIERVGYVAAITGNRFGAENSTIMSSLKLEYIYFGEGLAIDFAMDNFFITIMKFGGIASIVLFLAWITLQIEPKLTQAQKRLNRSVLLIFLLSGIGAFHIGMNRVGLLMIVLLILSGIDTRKLRNENKKVCRLSS